MPDIKNIPDYSSLPETRKQKFQRGFHEDDLNYLASYAVEANDISDNDVAKIHSKIDARVKSGSGITGLNSFYVLLCGIFIGISVFFVVFDKSKTHDAHYEAINELSVHKTKTQALIAESDTAATSLKSTYHKEHFSIQHSAEQIAATEVYENLETKSVSEINLPKTETSHESNFIYIPNAPVIYIKDLKIANYQLYYFKNNENVVMNGDGDAARYSDRNEAKDPSQNMNSENNYYAHHILKDAMISFNAKDYTGCAELMELLYNYNKSDVNAQFYLGMSYFYLAKNVLSMRYLNEVLNNSVNVFQQEAEFYKAVCLKNNSQIKESEDLLNSISSKKLFYAKRAEEVLKEMH